MSYNDITWFPLTAGLTVLGLVLSYFLMRRNGLRPALRWYALSLLPIAAYLTGATEMLWKVGTAIGQFGTGFVFSTTKWVGIGVTGLAIALFLAAGGRERRKAARQARREAAEERKSADLDGSGPALGATPARTGTDLTRAMSQARRPEPVPVQKQAAVQKQATAKASRKAQPVDDDLKDIEDILRKRGI